MDQSADDMRGVRENLAALSSRVANLDNKLSDISSAVRTLSQPPAAPPPPAVEPRPLPEALPFRPPGISAESLWLNAFRDYSSGKDELAMMEFNDYLKYFPTAENAASAQYYVGQLYNRAKMYDDAVQAFDAVLERYPDNPKTPDALYGKADALLHGGHRAEAAAEFKDFLARFPTHSLARNAQAQLRELGTTTRPRAPHAAAAALVRSLDQLHRDAVGVFHKHVARHPQVHRLAASRDHFDPCGLHALQQSIHIAYAQRQRRRPRVRNP